MRPWGGILAATLGLPLLISCAEQGCNAGFVPDSTTVTVVAGTVPAGSTVELCVDELPCVVQPADREGGAIVVVMNDGTFVGESGTVPVGGDLNPRLVTLRADGVAGSPWSGTFDPVRVDNPDGSCSSPGVLQLQLDGDLTEA